MDRAPRLSLDLLRAFRAAASQLSFTRAANELYVTQSAISRAVKTLEDQLGQPLFHRVNRTLTLTHAGEALYQATDEALALIDTTAARLAGSERTLAVTTTVALASTWLVPKLPRFTRKHPRVDVRIASSNDWVDLDREHVDIALRFLPLGSDVPATADFFVEYRTFPVCSPAIARSRKQPIRTPADLAHFVRLDFETLVYGRPWYDWDRWFDGMKLKPIAPAGTMRFSHYDQVIDAAMEGSGIAIGKWPHLARHLREGKLVAPLGMAGVARVGTFFVMLSRSAAGRDAVAAFVAWLRAELREDVSRAPAAFRGTDVAALMGWPGRGPGVPSRLIAPDEAKT
jgi:LysR family glycine cleavage system transcriptional activator